MHPTIDEASGQLRAALDGASRGLIEREVLVELIALAAVAGEHLLVIGPPGTAKSEAVRRVARGLEARYFEYLLGRFTEPSEIFGPIDLRKLRDGVVETETAGMLPEAEIAFLDEVFLGSTAILNTLLGVLNERVFRRGHTNVRCPLRVCVGASNGLPEGESLAAFADRFLLRSFLEAIPDPRLEDLLEGGWRLGQQGEGPRASLAVIDALSSAAQRAEVGGVRGQLSHAIRLLRRAGVSFSDRRAVKVQRLVAAAAVIAGRASPTEADLWPIVFAVPTQPAQAVAREVLRELLSASQSQALAAAAEEASAGPAARASRLLAAGNTLLGARPGEGAELEAWQLKLEGVARELDAGFAADRLTDELRGLRAALVAAIGPAR
jgi:MoxR-like ATPase